MNSVMDGLRALEESVASLTAAGQPFELERVEIRGDSYRCYRNQPANLPEYFRVMASHGEKPFVVMGDERFGYAEAYHITGQIAAALADRYGIEPGDRVAIAMRNNPQWMLAFIGALRAGAIVVPMRAGIRPRGQRREAGGGGPGSGGATRTLRSAA